MTLSETRKYTFHLITFEQNKYYISNNEKDKIQKKLFNQGIIWYPLKFHTGKFLLLKKTYDFAVGSLLVFWIRIRHNAKLIIALSNISGSFSFILSKLLKIKLMILNYEPHSLFQVELGLWSSKSLKYLILNRLETYAGIYGDYILTGTDHMVKLLSKKAAHGHIFRAPSSLDISIYKYNSLKRLAVRDEFNINDKKVLLYLGKLGGIYYGQEVADLCKYLSNKIKNIFCLIVTPSDHKVANYYFDNAKMDKQQYLITEAFNRNDVIGFISASDIGLSAVPPTSSQKYRSPIKTGEYLLCGLPYITCSGISEDDKYAIDYNVGVVIKSFNYKHVDNKIQNIESFFNEDKQLLRKRCRYAGTVYRDKKNIDKIFNDIMREVFPP
jgi:hypothetical protein